MRDIRIIAHRGASFREPENSLAAFGIALEMGAHVIEMDVRTTMDGQAIIIHDESLHRTTGGAGNVGDMNLDDIKSLRLRNGQRIPELREALEMLKDRCTVNLELKDAASISAAGGVVKDMGLWKEVIFSSFHGPWLVDLKLRYPHARVAFVSDDRKLDCVRIAASIGAEAMNIGTRLATMKEILRAKKEGLDVNVWTVNRPRSMRIFIERGANGIITDRPDVLATVIGDLVIG